MKTHLFPAFFVLFTMLMSGCHSSPDHPVTEDFPALKFKSTEVDVGEAEKQFCFSFTFQNISNQPIEGINITTSCGCTNASLEPQSVLPGQEGTISIDVDQSGKGLGTHAYLVFVEYAEGKKQRFQRLAIKANNGTGATVVPDQITASSYYDEPVVRDICLVDLRRTPLEIEEITPSCDWIKCHIIEKPTFFNNGWSYHLEAVIDSAKLSTGSHSGSVVIKTSDLKYQVFTVPIDFQKISPIIVTPEKVSLTSQENQEKLAGHCTVRHRDGVPLTLFVDSENVIESSIIADSENCEYTVSFSIPKQFTDHAPHFQTATLKIQTPCQREIPVILSLL